MLARIKDMYIWFQLNLLNASILSYDRGYVPAKASFFKPIGQLLSVSNLKDFHDPVRYYNMNAAPRSTGNTNSGTRELTLKCNLSAT